MNTDRILIQAYAALLLGNEQAAIDRLRCAASLCSNGRRWSRIMRALKVIKSYRH